MSNLRNFGRRTNGDRKFKRFGRQGVPELERDCAKLGRHPGGQDRGAA